MESMEYRKARRMKIKQSPHKNHIDPDRMRRYTMEPDDIVVFKNLHELKDWDQKHNEIENYVLNH